MDKVCLGLSGRHRNNWKCHDDCAERPCNSGHRLMQMGTFKSYRRINNSPVSVCSAARYRHIMLSNLTRAPYYIVDVINTVVKLKRGFRFDPRSILHGLAIFRLYFCYQPRVVYGETFVHKSSERIRISKNETRPTLRAITSFLLDTLSTSCSWHYY